VCIYIYIEELMPTMYQAVVVVLVIVIVVVVVVAAAAAAVVTCMTLAVAICTHARTISP
jgi:hypothetical protein